MSTTYYEETGDPALRFAPLGGPADAETVIVGGGFAGLGTALSLHEHGAAGCMVLEGETIGRGASGRNGGFVSGVFAHQVEAACAVMAQALVQTLCVHREAA